MSDEPKPDLRTRLRGYWRRIREEGSSPGELAAAVFLGLFLGVTPFYGVQMLLVLAIATALRLNRLAAVVAVQTLIPPIYAFLVVASLEVGNLLLNGTWLGIGRADLPTNTQEGWDLLSKLSGVWLLGSLVVGFVVAGMGATLTYFLALRTPEEEAEAIEREWLESQDPDL